MANTNVVSASDPLALEKLTQKLEACEKQQVHMKEVNAHFRKHGTCKGFPELTDAQAEKLETSIASHPWDTQPFPSYALQNNNQEINRLKKRIKQITFDREVGFSGWEFEGGHAEANKEANRLQLFFDEKPDENKRTQLKAHGFKWAPSQNAWQRQLNDNAIYAAGRLDFVRPSDGSTVRDKQPKAPVRSGTAR